MLRPALADQESANPEKHRTENPMTDLGFDGKVAISGEAQVVAPSRDAA